MGGVPGETNRMHGTSWNRVTGSCELSDMAARNQIPDSALNRRAISLALRCLLLLLLFIFFLNKPFLD